MICPNCKKETPDNKLYCKRCKKYCHTEEVKKLILQAKKAETTKKYHMALRYYKKSLILIPENMKIRNNVFQKIEDINSKLQSNKPVEGKIQTEQETMPPEVPDQKELQYYYLENQAKKGPYTFELLKSHPINPNTMIWHKGMDKWTPAKRLSEFDNYFNSNIAEDIPPPPPPIFDLPKAQIIKDVEGGIFILINLFALCSISYFIKLISAISGKPNMVILPLFFICSFILPIINIIILKVKYILRTNLMVVSFILSSVFYGMIWFSLPRHIRYYSSDFGVMLIAIIPITALGLYGTYKIFNIHYLAWKSIQNMEARTTPLKAILLFFIPIFHFYWWYVITVGLFNDMNNALIKMSITDKAKLLNKRVAGSLYKWMIGGPFLYLVVLFINVIIAESVSDKEVAILFIVIVQFFWFFILFNVFSLQWKFLREIKKGLVILLPDN